MTAVTRQKKALGEELQTSRQELDRLASLLTKIGKEKEELARGKAELAVACTAFESENRQQAEIIAGGDYSIQQSCRRMLIILFCTRRCYSISLLSLEPPAYSIKLSTYLRTSCELITGLRSEKEGLETAVFETQQSMTLLENKKEALESENQEMLLRKEQLNGELQRIR